MDLRARLIAAIDDGRSCRATAARFGVAGSIAGLRRFFKRHGMARKKDQPRY
jgi:transposase